LFLVVDSPPKGCAVGHNRGTRDEGGGSGYSPMGSPNPKQGGSRVGTVAIAGAWITRLPAAVGDLLQHKLLTPAAESALTTAEGAGTDGE
jgi:hypothetical protein